MNNYKRYLISAFKIGLAFFIFLGVRRFCDDRTDGFTAVMIDRNIPYDTRWDTAPLSLEEEKNVAQILDQPYYFLGRGGQSYVFISKDRKNVLKFFKKYHAIPDSWIEQLDRAIPLSLASFRAEQLQNRDERFSSIFSSCKLAYESLKKETGLIYLHLNPTQAKHKSIQIYDKCGIAHTIDLDSTSFIVQKRAHLIFSRIKRQLQQNDVEGAKRSICTMIDYIAARSKAGIRDTDNALKRNYGYIEDMPISVDVGSFVLDETLKSPKAYKKELLRKTRKLRKWIAKHHSELLPFYQEHIQALLEAYPP